MPGIKRAKYGGGSTRKKTRMSNTTQPYKKYRKYARKSNLSRKIKAIIRRTSETKYRVLSSDEGGSISDGLEDKEAAQALVVPRNSLSAADAAKMRAQIDDLERKLNAATTELERKRIVFFREKGGVLSKGLRDALAENVCAHGASFSSAYAMVVSAPAA
jgi:hypothetical protein